jgi:hypothetical protein
MIAAAGSPISQPRVRGKFMVTSDSGWRARQQRQYRREPWPVALRAKWRATTSAVSWQMISPGCARLVA